MMLLPETEIEVIATKEDKVFKTVMTYEKALKIKKKKGFYYRFYQMGYSQFKT